MAIIDPWRVGRGLFDRLSGDFWLKLPLIFGRGTASKKGDLDREKVREKR